MTGRKQAAFAILLITLLALPSCGGGPVAVATVTPSSLDSDVVTGAETVQNGVCTIATPIVKPDDVSINISALVQNTTGANPTRIIMDWVDITFTPADTFTSQFAPIPMQRQVLGRQQIAPGTSATVSVRVASQELKQSLSSLICTNTILKYYVIFHFQAYDLNSGDTVNITDATMNIRFADFEG